MSVTLEQAMAPLGIEPDKLSDYRVEADRVLMKLVRKPNEVIIWKASGEVEKIPSRSITIAKGEEIMQAASPEVLAFADNPGEEEASVDLGYVEYTGKSITRADVSAHIKARTARRAAKLAASRKLAAG